MNNEQYCYCCKIPNAYIRDCDKYNHKIILTMFYLDHNRNVEYETIGTINNLVYESGYSPHKGII